METRGKKSLVKIVEGQGDTTARTCVSNVCPTHVYSKFNWLSIFEAPLISRNRDRNRVCRLNSEFKRRGCVKLRPRRGLKIISPTTMLHSRGVEKAGSRRMGIGSDWNWPLTTSRPCLSLRRRPREELVLNFNVFNPEYQIFGHFSRSGDDALRDARVSVGFY